MKTVADAYITTTVAAKLSRLNAKQIGKWFDDGQLDGFRTPGEGGHRRISVASLRLFLLASGVPTDLLDARFPAKTKAGGG